MSQKNYKIGIRREQFNKWERRCALPPKYCQKLLYDFENNLTIKVQPSTSRVYPDKAFVRAGCIISEDISDCDLIIGVKQVPLEHLYEGKTYMFFSHVIKAQEQNMEMLDEILKKKIRLIDYEKIVNKEGKRQVAFGKFAGNSGAVDILHGLGNFLLSKGYGTPFINIPQSYNYTNIHHAKNIISQVGKELEIQGFADELVPFVVGVSGSGRTANGAKEILELLPHEYIKPQNLQELIERSRKSPENFSNRIYIVQFTAQDLVESKFEGDKFDKQDYYQNPSKYKNKFQSKYLPHLSVFINCIYWEDKYCKEIEKHQLEKQWRKKQLRLLAISDVTCDYMGSIDFLSEFSTIDEPFLLYNPEEYKFTKDYKTNTNGILYDSIENMPTQFPVDASELFGKHLYPFIMNILESDQSKPLEQQGLDYCIENAVITLNGELTDKYNYINKLRRLKQIKQNDIQFFRKKSTIGQYSLTLKGHLFDTLSINKILDCLCDEFKCLVAISQWQVGGGSHKESVCYLQIKEVKDIEEIKTTIEKICNDSKISYDVSYLPNFDLINEEQIIQ